MYKFFFWNKRKSENDGGTKMDVNLHFIRVAFENWSSNFSLKIGSFIFCFHPFVIIVLNWLGEDKKRGVKKRERKKKVEFAWKCFSDFLLFEEGFNCLFCKCFSWSFWIGNQKSFLFKDRPLCGDWKWY